MDIGTTAAGSGSCVDQLRGGQRAVGVDGCTLAIDVGILLGIGDPGLELRVVIEVLAPVHAPQRRKQDTGQRGGDGDHQDLGD